MKSFRKKIGEKGFTLVEAMIAMGVLVIGIVGLQSVMRRSLVSSVKAWDREIKTSIGQSRLEEHKAQIFSSYVPNMVLPIIVPTPNSGQTIVNFGSNTLTYTSQVKVSIDGTNNAVTAQAGYGVVYPTPSVQPTYYYGAVASPTPLSGSAWISVNGRSACDQTAGDIAFNITTPPNINGSIALWFADYNDLQRQQQVVLGYPRQVYAAGSISKTPTAPTTFTVPINSFDSANGILSLEVQQMGGSGEINNYGTTIENGGDNSYGWKINCANVLTATPTATFASCPPGQATTIQAGDNSLNVVNQFQVRGFNPQYFRSNGATGSASYVFNVTCAGVYKVTTWTRSGNSGNSNMNVVLSGSSVTPLYAGGVTANWYTNPGSNYQNNFGLQDISDGNSFASSSPAQWQINTTGNYTLTFYPGTTTGYPRVAWFSLTLVSPLPTPTPSGFTATPTRTPTPGGSVCTFPGTPIPLAIASSGPGSQWYPGTPMSYQQWGCDDNLTALTLSGVADASGIVRMQSVTMITNGPNGPVTGFNMDAAGKLKGDFRLMSGMSVTLRAITNAATVAATITTVANDGWYEAVSPNIAAGTTIKQFLVDFQGIPNTGATKYLALDSLRTEYTTPLNPNCVLMGASLSALDSYRDTTSYAPNFVVDSSVQPFTDNANSNGYRIQVVVHNAKGGVLNDTFPPVTITNSVSP